MPSSFSLNSIQQKSLAPDLQHTVSDLNRDSKIFLKYYEYRVNKTAIHNRQRFHSQPM